MPLFEFRCLKCGLQFEKLVRKTGAAGEVTCPMCNSRKVDELLSAFASPARNAHSDSRAASCKPSGG
jgi:putative FmdB family regulatory protein